MAYRGGTSLDYAASNRLLLEYERQLAAKPGKTRKTALRVMRRAVRSGKSAMSKEIRETVNLKKKVVDKSIRTGVENEIALTGYVRARNRPTLLIEYMSQRQRITAIRAGRAGRSRGVSVKTHKKKGRRLYAGAFVAVMPSGHVDVYRRVRRSRLPIKKVYGPNLTTEFERSFSAFERKQAAQFQKELERVLFSDLDITK